MTITYRYTSTANTIIEEFNTDTQRQRFIPVESGNRHYMELVYAGTSILPALPVVISAPPVALGAAQVVFTESSNSISSTTSNEYRRKVRLEADTGLVASGTGAEAFRLLWYYEWSYTSTNSEFESCIRVDSGDVIAEVEWRPAHSSSSAFSAVSGYYDMTLSSGTHTFDLDYRSSHSNKEARIRNSKLSLAKLTIAPGGETPPQLGD